MLQQRCQSVLLIVLILSLVLFTTGKSVSGVTRGWTVSQQGDAEEEATKIIAQSSSAGSNPLSRLWNKALRQSLYEQEVEDVNAVHKIDNHLARRLIVMPLTADFKPHQADLMHGKIQYGDKCSLPTSIGRLIFEKRYEVPWIFELKPVRSVESDFAPKRLQPIASTTTPTSTESDSNVELGNENVNPITDEYFRSGKLNKAYISPLDFRSPENYIFLPKWMMRDLNLKTNDLVDVSLVRIKLASLVVFQPLSLDWDKLMEEHKDPKALLEHEINKYASLTTGSTIYINIKGKEYPLYVKETQAEGGVKVQGVRVQDSDIRTDIDRSVLDKLIKEQEKDKRRAK